jgi:hypothetical protein
VNDCRSPSVTLTVIPMGVSYSGRVKIFIPRQQGLGTIYMTPSSSLPHRVSSFVLVAWLLSSSASAGTPARHQLSGPVRQGCEASSCGQLLPGDAATDDASNERVQAFERVALHVAGVQAKGELVNVAVKVLPAGVVVDAMESTTEDGPHGFDAVRVRVAPHVFLGRVVDDLVSEEKPVQFGVGGGVVREQVGADLHASVYDALDSVRGAVGDRHGDGAPAALTEPQDAHLAGPALLVLEPLPLVLVVLLPADVDLVHLDVPAQLAAAGQGIGAARLAEPGQHEPRGLLRDADFLRHLERRDALARRDEQVHGVDPLVERDVRALEDGPRANGEVQIAGVATVVAALAGRDALAGLALRADCPVRPKSALQVQTGRLVHDRRERERGGVNVPSVGVAFDDTALKAVQHLQVLRKNRRNFTYRPNRQGVLWRNVDTVSRPEVPPGFVGDDLDANRPHATVELPDFNATARQGVDGEPGAACVKEEGLEAHLLSLQGGFDFTIRRATTALALVAVTSRELAHHAPERPVFVGLNPVDHQPSHALHCDLHTPNIHYSPKGVKYIIPFH